MSIPRHTPTDYERNLENVSECLRDFDQLSNGLPLGDMIDYARESGFGQEILDGLDKLSGTASVLVYDGPSAIWDFAKAANMTDELVAREQQERDERRAREADPNSLINVLRERVRSQGGIVTPVTGEWS